MFPSHSPWVVSFPHHITMDATRLLKFDLFNFGCNSSSSSLLYACRRNCLCVFFILLCNPPLPRLTRRPPVVRFTGYTTLMHSLHNHQNCFLSPPHRLGCATSPRSLVFFRINRSLIFSSKAPRLRPPPIPRSSQNVVPPYTGCTTYRIHLIK